MKILLIHQSFASPEDPGGTRHFELLLRARQAGCKPIVVAGALNYLTGKNASEITSWATEQNYDGVRVLRAYAYPALHRSFVWRVLSFISFMITSFVIAWRVGKIDVVMGTSPPLFQPISAWLISVLRRRPFLLEIRDLWPEFAIDMGVLRNPVLIWLARRLERFLYSRATHLLVNSPAYRDYLINKQVPPHKISFIANGVDPTVFDPTADGKEFRQRHDLLDKFVVLYAGALGVANDLTTVIDAASLLSHRPEVQFVFVGDGKERINLESKCRSLGLRNVSFTGAYPKKQMPAVLAAADVCLAVLQNIPMFTTTYPNKVFDYMAAGRATLLAIDGVIRSALDDAQAGTFVPPGNPQAMADAVLWCAEHTQEARNMGANGRRFVEHHFNRDRQSQQFVQLILKLAGVRPSTELDSAAVPNHESHHCGREVGISMLQPHPMAR
ncbi:MAG: glycosyltransferase family 4 protein [Pirellulales bacterium]|nr:glycosyltransferase family 4 protein [Pirellulales bacterium]